MFYLGRRRLVRGACVSPPRFSAETHPMTNNTSPGGNFTFPAGQPCSSRDLFHLPHRHRKPGIEGVRSGDATGREGRCVSPRCLRKAPKRSQKSPPCPPLIPKSFGNCVLARLQGDPRLETEHHRLGDEVHRRPGPGEKGDHRDEQGGAGDMLAWRVGSIGQTAEVEPIRSEIAEVTVMEVCRELQKSQKTRPPKRQA